MRIAHIRTSHLNRSDEVRSVRERLEHVRGVAGVAAIPSMGLTSVLYDEQAIDPVRISDELLLALEEALASVACGSNLRGSDTHAALVGCGDRV